jgi:hypothetical protein
VSDAIKRAVASLAAAWAERDPARRGELLASAITDDIRTVIGAGKREIRGRAAFEAEIVSLQRRVPWSARSKLSEFRSESGASQRRVESAPIGPRDPTASGPFVRRIRFKHQK